MRSLPLLALSLALALTSMSCKHQEEPVPPPGQQPAPPPMREPRAQAPTPDEALDTARGEEESAPGTLSPTEEAARGRRHRPPRPDAGTTADAGTQGQPDAGTPGPVDGHPAPAGCNNRPPTVTEMNALVRIDVYKGIQHGRNGDHEIAEGTITAIKWTTKGSVVDTKNVHLALNIASPVNPDGLPKEIPVAPGHVIELTGEYIPARTANAKNANGSAAVLHFTHSPCGAVVIDGQVYQ